MLVLLDTWTTDADTSQMTPVNMSPQTDNIVHLGAVVNVNIRFRAKSK
jgi:hypothetical protein